MYKKSLSVFLILALLIAVFAGCGKDTSGATGAETNSVAAPTYIYTSRDLPEGKYITPADSFAGGTGTQNDPYQISNAAELALLNKKVCEFEGIIFEGYYILTADIALNDVTNFDSWSTSAPEYSWQPIGFGSVTHFEGVFDGKGHTISGIYINTNCENSDDAYGLFGEQNGIVKNVNIEKSYFEVSGRDNCLGSVVGNLLTDGIVENCTSSAVFKCYDSTCGGIVGKASGGIFAIINSDETEEEHSKITGCKFTGSIDVIKEDSAGVYIGGIVGWCKGYIDSCVNEGTLSFTGSNTDSAGGIAGSVNDGYVTNCKNSGSLKYKASEPNFTVSGGIAGKLFLSNTGSEKYMSRGITVSKCENTGIIEGALNAGGIAGQINNERNDYCLKLTDCINKGKVIAEGHAGGVVGGVTCKGDKQNAESIIMENCKNEADLSDGIAGGIIGYLMSATGDIVIKNCVNSGNINTQQQYAAGIIAYWIMEGYPENTSIKIEGCKNSGSIAADIYVGGNIGMMDLPALVEMGKNVDISLTDCVNTGNVSAASINGYIGGIVGCCGMKNIPTVIDNCTNKGTLSFLSAPEISDDEADIMTFSRIAGGIVGRIGKGLMLTTDKDNPSDANIQTEKGLIKVMNCTSTGSLEVVEPDAVNIKNWFGGVIGNASAEDGYSFYVSDCKYSGFDRGLGMDDVDDVGTKI